ncbi:DUF2591 domain-containing protein [Xenorhabdus bovienii]|uniref:phage protein NinX family protein n=1 Tax=Xenorhabdus bovienii TaxID=40576 RepID=UPI0023B29B0A|nr:phage protein NinX family protein [Xenorhabdus bovienii]MDE9437097.1 DUF2591 domain-containing protein [Xenorhabdus bovienii]MDE9498740.1 DUF2591 domain-containing protein [Xenorhabdus bovienii]
MKIKTSELTGRALDWAVARAIGAVEITEGTTRRLELPDGYSVYDRYASTFSPSTTWSQCGSLIERYLIELNNQVISENEVEHWATCVDEYIYGLTALEAACRIVVHVKLGDEIEIPDELLETR